MRPAVSIKSDISDARKITSPKMSGFSLTILSAALTFLSLLVNEGISDLVSNLNKSVS